MPPPGRVPASQAGGVAAAQQALDPLPDRRQVDRGDHELPARAASGAGPAPCAPCRAGRAASRRRTAGLGDDRQPGRQARARAELPALGQFGAEPASSVPPSWKQTTSRPRRAIQRFRSSARTGSRPRLKVAIRTPSPAGVALPELVDGERRPHQRPGDDRRGRPLGDPVPRAPPQAAGDRQERRPARGRASAA